MGRLGIIRGYYDEAEIVIPLPSEENVNTNRIASQLWINKSISSLMPSHGALDDIDFNGSFWVAVGQHGQMIKSEDQWGFSWVAITSPFGDESIQQIRWISFLNLWVAVGVRTGGASSVKIYTSPDAETWTASTTGLSFGANSANGIDYNGSLIVIVGESGKIATSPDAVNWTMRTSPFGSSHCYMVAWSGTLNLWAACSNGGKIAISADGIDWSLQTVGLGTSNVYCVRWCYDRFIAGTDDGKMVTSLDGVNWSLWAGFDKTAWGSRYITDCLGAEGLYIICGQNGFLYVSYDAENWGFVFNNQPYNLFTNSGLISGIRYSNNMIFAVGWDGTNPVMINSAPFSEIVP